MITHCYNITKLGTNIILKRMEGQKEEKALERSLSYSILFNLELFVLGKSKLNSFFFF